LPEKKKVAHSPLSPLQQVLNRLSEVQLRMLVALSSVDNVAYPVLKGSLDSDFTD
jgi:hypothetical protein